MESEFQFILSVFAVFFLAQLITVYAAPLHIFLRWRQWLKPRYGDLHELFCCPYCLGAYIAIPFAVTLNVNIFLAWFAITGAQWFLQGIAGRENNDP